MSDKIQRLVLQVGGWAWGQQPHPLKKFIVTEASIIVNAIGPAVDSDHCIGSMTTPDESLNKEVSSAMGNLLGPKFKVRLGTWNVRTMYQTSKAAQVLQEMEKNQLDIPGISECRWIGAGKQVTSSGAVILHLAHA